MVILHMFETRYRRVNLTVPCLKIRGKARFDLTLSEELPDQVNGERQYHADQDHGGDGKIEPEVLPFNADIPGQFAKPVKFIVEEKDDKADDNERQSGKYDVFSCLMIHKAKIIALPVNSA